MKIYELVIGKEYLYNNAIFKLDKDRILLMKIENEWFPFVGVNYNDVVKFNFEDINYNILQTKPVDTKVLVRNSKSGMWLKRHFAGYKDGKFYVFVNGKSSYTTTNTIFYNYIKLYKDEEDNTEE
jgi:hypothetical protein